MSEAGWDWDNPSGKSGNGSSKVKMTKFPVGVTHIQIVDVAPYVSWTHWQPTAERSFNCPGFDCPICEIRKRQKAAKQPYTQALAKRFRINIYNLETKQYEVMDQGKTFFEDLRDLKKDVESKGGDITNVVFKVRRRGEGQDDTSYRLDIEPDTAPIVIDESKKTDLTEYFKPHTVEQINRFLGGEKWVDIFKKPEDNADADQSQEPPHDEEFVVQ
jgi:hypothetical protein